MGQFQWNKGRIRDFGFGFIDKIKGLDGQLPTFQVHLLFIVSPFAPLLLLLWLVEVLKRIFAPFVVVG